MNGLNEGKHADDQAMWASDMMGEHVIEHCQSLLLLSVLMVCPLSAGGAS
jgi:hypothetical protein